MKPRKQKARGLIGRLFLAGTLAVTGLVQGCQPLSNVQEQNLHSLTRWGYDYTMQQKRNKAIANSGGNVVVNINSNTNSNQKYDTITLKNGNYIQGDILAEKENEIIVDMGVEILNIPKEEIIQYIINN